MKPEKILEWLTLAFIGGLAYVLGLIIGGTPIQALSVAVLTIIVCKIIDP